MLYDTNTMSYCCSSANVLARFVWWYMKHENPACGRNLVEASCSHWRSKETGVTTRFVLHFWSRDLFRIMIASAWTVFPSPMSSARIPPLVCDASLAFIQANPILWCFNNGTSMSAGVFSMPSAYSSSGRIPLSSPRKLSASFCR